MRNFGAKGLVGFTILLPVSQTTSSPLEPLGICSLSDARPACWDLSGVSRPDLLAKIHERLDETKLDLKFRQERKNRYVVLRVPLFYAVRFSSGSDAEIGPTLDGGAGEPWAILRFAAPPRATTWQAVATVGSVVDPPVEVQIRPGEKADVAGDRIEVGKVAVIASEMLPLTVRGFGFWDGKAWFMMIGHRAETSLTNGLRFTPLDRGGQPIRDVDREGRPVASNVAEKELSFAPAHFPRAGAHYSTATFADDPYASPPRSVVRCYTNIDPRFIAKLRIARIVEREQLFGPYSLDPQPGGP